MAGVGRPACVVDAHVTSRDPVGHHPLDWMPLQSPALLAGKSYYDVRKMDA